MKLFSPNYIQFQFKPQTFDFNLVAVVMATFIIIFFIEGVPFDTPYHYNKHAIIN